MPERTAADRAGQHLRALAAGLADHGIDSEVNMSGYRPRLRLHLPGEDLQPDACFEDNVLAAPDADGHWSFWWPWVERISDADSPAKAAEIISGPLKPDDSTDECW
jgi:hypothetical protein